MKIEDYFWAVANARSSSEAEKLSSLAVADNEVRGGKMHETFQWMCRVIGRVNDGLDATTGVTCMLRAAAEVELGQD